MYAIMSLSAAATRLRVGIVGAGTTGPAAACLLRDWCAADVHLIEKAHVARPKGAGLLLQPTGLSVLAHLGLHQQALEQGHAIQRLWGQSVLNQRKVFDLGYDDNEEGLHGLGIHRGALFEMLMSAVKRREGHAVGDRNTQGPSAAAGDGSPEPLDAAGGSIQLHLGYTVHDVVQHEPSGGALLLAGRTPDAAEIVDRNTPHHRLQVDKHITRENSEWGSDPDSWIKHSAPWGDEPFDLVIVADGTWSRLRRVVQGKHSLSGCKWVPGKGLTTEPVASSAKEDLAEFEKGVKKFSFGASWAAVPCPDPQWSATLQQKYRGAHIMAGALPVGRLAEGHDAPPHVALFWSLPEGGDSFLRWQDAGPDAWANDIQRTLQWPELSSMVKEQVPSLDSFAYAEYNHVHLPRWRHPSGNVIVVGDAAHGTSPQLGQGANMGLLDSLALAACLRAALVPCAHQGDVALGAAPDLRPQALHLLRHGQSSLAELLPLLYPSGATKTAERHTDAAAREQAGVPGARASGLHHLSARTATGLAPAVAARSAVSSGLRTFEATRGPSCVFYQLASLALTPFFQSKSRTLAAVRDYGVYPSYQVSSWMQHEQVRTLAGLKTGLLTHLPTNALWPAHTPVHFPGKEK